MTASLSAGYRSNKQQVLEQPGALRPVPNQACNFPLHLVGAEGQLQVHTAPYRGSFSGVLSEALRAAGLGRRVMVAQFLKGGVSQGPEGSINLCGRLEWLRPSIPCCIAEHASLANDLHNQTSTVQAVKEVWEVCKAQIIAENIDQLVLDEVGLATALGYLNENDLINTLEKRPSSMDVILTGPSIPSRAIEMADQVTELRCGS